MKDQRIVQEYEKRIARKKQLAHDNLILYIDLNPRDLLKEWALSNKQSALLEQAMKESMLEGDQILSKSKSSKGLNIRYFTDHLSPDRKKYKKSSSES